MTIVECRVYICVLETLNVNSEWRTFLDEMQAFFGVGTQL